MLTLRTRTPAAAPACIVAGHPDLRIRNLLDDPALRRAMGLDVPAIHAAPARPARPAPRFDRRRLLDAAAA